MSESPDREKELFEEAMRLFAAGDLAKARDLFELIALENGENRRRAEYYLAKIAEMTTRGRSRATRGAPPRREGPFRGVPMSPPADPPRSPPPPDRGPGGEAEAEAASAPGTPQALRRTPHMDLSPDPPVEPGARLQVRVYTDAQAFRPGESGEGFVIEAPPEQKRFEVDVWLSVSEPFGVEGPPVKRLVILRDEEKSEPVEFTVLRQEGPAPAEPVLFSALFSYRGRPCGRVSREVPVSSSQPAEPAKDSLPEAEIRIDAEAQRPDLSVRIVRNGADEHLYDCLVQTPLLPEYKDGVTEIWRLSSLAPDLVKEKMARFMAKNTSPLGRIAALRGAGARFFEASPKLFQKVFWELIDRNLPLRTISILTEEPSIPWELMVPKRPGDEEDREPLGVVYLVSRWTAQSHILPPQRVPLTDAFVVAPRDSRLTSAEEEVQMIEKELQIQRIDPASLDSLNDSLGQQGRSLLHFICHGKSGSAGSQVLVLERLEELEVDQFQELPGIKKAFRSAKPFVFLNACEVGRQEPALVGAGGFAEAFMNMGASGVIAPLWSVKDAVAHKIAEVFYDRIKKEPNTPFAQILADLRKESYVEGGGEDTYAAYCFYGDPLARRSAT